jgi:uncharacterized membrane protein
VILVAVLACAVPGGSVADSAETCDDAPYADWNSFGHGFVIENCQACHAAEGDGRQGAPEDVRFDTPDDVWVRADRVLVRAAAEPPSMPPMGGTSESDRVLLRAWLECGDSGS